MKRNKQPDNIKATVKSSYVSGSLTAANQELLKALLQPNYQDLIDAFKQKVMSEWHQKLKAYLKQNLKQLGFDFENDNGFYEFCSRRVSRISFEHNPNYYEFYIDYFNEQDTGKFIGSYSDNVEIINEGSSITYIFGKSIG